MLQGVRIISVRTQPRQGKPSLTKVSFEFDNGGNPLRIYRGYKIEDAGEDERDRGRAEVGEINAGRVVVRNALYGEKDGRPWILCDEIGLEQDIRDEVGRAVQEHLRAQPAAQQQQQRPASRPAGTPPPVRSAV